MIENQHDNETLYTCKWSEKTEAITITIYGIEASVTECGRKCVVTLYNNNTFVIQGKGI